MKKIALSGIWALVAYAAAAQSTTAGVLGSYDFKGNTLTIKLLAGEEVPKVGMDVAVHKEFTTKLFGADVKGTHGLANGTVKTITTKELVISVSEWTGTLEENGVVRPMAKQGDSMLVEWGGEQSE